MLQTEASECGLACLAMIANFYGFNVDLTTIRAKYPISSRGINLSQMMEIATKLHLTSRAVKIDLEQLDELNVPCILHWEMKHFVVLKKVSKNKVLIHDPAVGERAISQNEVNLYFTGVALILNPNPEFKKNKERNDLKISHFWSKIVGLKRSLSIILLLSILIQVFALISPYYMQVVVDDVLLRNDRNLLMVLAIGFVLLLCIDTVTNYLRQIAIVTLSAKLNIQISANVFHHLIRLPIDYFSKRHMGDIVSRFSSLSKIREIITTSLIAAIIDGAMGLLTLFIMFIYSPKLSIIVITVVSIYGGMRYILFKPFRLMNEEKIVASAKESSHFMESVRAIQTIKLFEKENERQNNWQNNLAEALNKDIKIKLWGVGFNIANKILFGLENIIVIYFAAISVMENVMTVGMLYAFMSYKSRFISSMDGLISKWIEFKMLGLHLERLSDLIFSPKDTYFSEDNELDNASNEQNLRGLIEVDSLSFAFSDIEKPVFEKISFIVKPNENVALIGASGSGKSTLLKCLMGIMSPSSGQVLVDGTSIKNIAGYRKRISAVMQEDQLLSGSIAENISCFDPDMDMEEVKRCSYLACIHKEISSMTMQYNTLVGDMGANLSGGQKQRIIIARALYKKPDILFMDEATSHLDIKLETMINSNIKAPLYVPTLCRNRL